MSRKMPDKCQCPKPELVGKRIDFLKTKGGDAIQAHDFRIECRVCNKFHSYMTGENFKIADIPTYDQLLG